MPLLDSPRESATVTGVLSADVVPLFRSEPYVWVTVRKRDPNCKELRDRGCSFPALVDTGTSDSFVLHEWHLEQWCGLDVKSTRKSGRPKVLFGHNLPVVLVDIWLARHNLDPRDAPPQDCVFDKLSLSNGIVVSTIYCSRAFSEVRETVESRSFWDYVPWIGKKERAAKDDVARFVEANLVSESVGNGTIPRDIHPRIPVIGVKLLRTNRLDLHFSTCEGHFSLTRLHESPAESRRP